MLSHLLSLTSEDLMQRESACDRFFTSSRVCAALRVILNLTIEKRGEIRTPERNITPHAKMIMLQCTFNLWNLYRDFIS